MKIPLDALLSALPDEGKELLGTAFIAILASQRGNENAEPCVSQSLSLHVSPQPPIASTNIVPRTDPRLRVARPMDAQSPLSHFSQNMLTLSQPSSITPTQKSTVEQPSTLVVESKKSTLESPDSSVLGNSSLPAPSSPPKEPDVLERELEGIPVEPKEIPLENALPPLSCSSPTTENKRSLVPCVVTMDSLDMDVESQGNRSHDVVGRSLSNSSDMEVEPPPSRYQSPFKIRYEPYSPNSPKTLPRLLGPFNDSLDKPLGYRPTFSEPGLPVRWGSPRNAVNRVGSRSPVCHSGFPRISLFGAKSDYSPVERVLNQDNHESESFAIPERSPHKISPMPTYRPASHGEPPKRKADLDQRARFHINASPLLVLEDVAKTHPYYFQSVERPPPVDESEEGEIVDDDNEMEESEDGATTSANVPRGTRDNIKRHPRDDCYNSFSSDFSNNTSVNNVDEWHDSLSASQSCSSSSRSSPLGRSVEQRRRRVSQLVSEEGLTRMIDGRADLKHHRWLPHADSEPSSLAGRHGSLEPTSLSFSRPDPARIPSRTAFDAQFIASHTFSGSVENSDQSAWDAETSLDEDMRVLPSCTGHSSRHAFISSTHVPRDAHKDPLEPKDHSSRTQVFSNKDVDYRRLPPELAVSSPRHSHHDYPSPRLPTLDRDRIDCADARPRYSIYHPRSTDVDRPDSGRESSLRSRNEPVTDRRDPPTMSEPGSFVVHHRTGVSRDNRRYARSERPRSRASHTSNEKDDTPHSYTKRRSVSSVRRDSPLLPSPIPIINNSGGLLSAPPVLPFSGTFLPSTFWPFPQTFNPPGSQPPQLWK